MAAPLGNKFWEARATSGASPKYDNAGDLWTDCVEYFEWVEANPLKAAEKVTFQGIGTIMELPKMRAMTLKGLCLFLGLHHSTWIDWRSSREDLSEIITRAEGIIFQQKFEGAAADLLNASIIARELGLADKQETESKITVDASDSAIKKLGHAIGAKKADAKSG